jgi:hypothetical protein
MEIPPAPPRFDIDAARDAIAAGQSVAEFARRNDHSASAVRHALAGESVSLPRRRGKVAVAFNLFLSSRYNPIGPPLTIGQRVFVEGWYRDPPAETGLSNALMPAVQ